MERVKMFEKKDSSVDDIKQKKSGIKTLFFFYMEKDACFFPI
jgi:hypothetical protein